MNNLKKNAASLRIKGRSKMSREDMETAIRKFKFKDVLTQSMGLCCTPCVETALRENLEIYTKQLAARTGRIIHDGDLPIDAATGEVVDCASQIY